MKRSSAPTMKDVAKEAGVALGTVSKVFNDYPVGEDYRKRVLEAADKLGYQLNSYARGLKTNKTYSIAVILPNIITPFFAVLAQNLCSSLIRRGYRMYLSITDADPDAEQRYISMAQQNQVDGIIALTYNPTLRVDGNIPFVSFDRYVGPGVPCVASDNFGGGQLAAKKLVEFGCRRLLFIRSGSPVFGESDKRRGGFESFCQTNAVEQDTLYIYDSQGFEPIRKFLSDHLSEGRLYYDGIFCCTDPLAALVRNTLARMGVQSPEDVQIIGFDGTTLYTGQPLPCSTIVQPIPLLAQTCVDIVLREDKTELPSLICLPVNYAAGGTTLDRA